MILSLPLPDEMQTLLRDFASGKTVPLRQRIMAYEAEARKAPQVKLQVFHHFAPGIYMRELHIPAGIITTGKIHKQPCLNILAKGERTTVIGDDMVRIKAPHIHLSPAGSKRASFTHEDSIWITVHANPDNGIDIEDIERALVCDTEEEYTAFLADQAERHKCLS